MDRHWFHRWETVCAVGPYTYRICKVCGKRDIHRKSYTRNGNEVSYRPWLDRWLNAGELSNRGEPPAGGTGLSQFPTNNTLVWFDESAPFDVDAFKKAQEVARRNPQKGQVIISLPKESGE